MKKPESNIDNPSKPDATLLDIPMWSAYVDSLDVDPLFVTISGAHIYGFPSPDSDVDLRGSHQLRLAKIVGLTKPNETIDRGGIHNGIEVDLVSHEIGKYLGLMVKNNGYVLEQIFSPIVIKGQSFLDQLRPLAQNCVTRNHYFHYRGFIATQKKLIQKQTPVTAKAMLYAYRVLCTGINLMQTGIVESD
jgi:predicted nucleotidyltransferase